MDSSPFRVKMLHEEGSKKKSYFYTKSPISSSVAHNPVMGVKEIKFLIKNI